MWPNVIDPAVIITFKKVLFHDELYSVGNAGEGL